jgi:hypothetical protein
MSSMFCPKCATTQPMNLSIAEQETTGPEGETIRLMIETYHCSICHSFVRSESVHERDDAVDDHQAPNGHTKDESRSING